MEEGNKTTQSSVGQVKKGLSITSMVLGIVAVVLFNSIISIPCSILAIIFGAIENKKHKNGFAKAGLILGIIAITITVVIISVSVYVSLNSGLFDVAKRAI